jgi:glycolate oxidase
MTSDVEEVSKRFLNLHEFIPAARRRITPESYGYLVGGTETETTLRRNRQALDMIALRPRVLRDVSRVDTSATFLGKKIRLPVALAPVGSLESFDPGGGALAGAAASAFGVPIFVSSVTHPGLEETALATPGPKIFQLYVRGDDNFVDDHYRRASDAGYDAFCLTVDTASYSRRERDIVARFNKPWRQRATGQNFQAALHWADVARFKEKNHRLPLILKGIGTGEDAAIACSYGVDMVYVSNHGGRQLDHGRGSMDVLPEVVAAVRGRARVIVDGGFSRGTDIAKAIALGADLVTVGRLYCYGLAAAGQAGVQVVLQLLEEEARICLALLGATRFGELDPSYVAPAHPVVPTHVHSAFPLLDFEAPPPEPLS